MSDTTPYVAIVDDDDAVLRALERLLRSAGYTARTFRSSHAFLDACADERPGCALVDLTMPGLNGLQLQQALLAHGWQCALVFISGHGDVRSSVQAMKAGAIDFLEKPFAAELLLTAVRAALEKDRAARAASDERSSIEQRLAGLTPREREVLEHVVIGRLNKQIAAALGTAEKTIKVHRARMLQKMGAGSLADLVRLAERVGLH